MEENYKIVDFNYWCPKCEYYDDDESDPYLKCSDCLEEPARVNTRRPLKYKEK